jgi:hypothetical protein
LKDVSSATATGLLQALTVSCNECGLDDYNRRLVGFLSDGASVNFGRKSGLLTLLRQQSPWIIGFHCMNHRLELAIRDACKESLFDDVFLVLRNIHSIFERSPKRMRVLKQFADVMGEEVSKPARASGTRWITHKLKAATILLKDYSVVISAMESMTDDNSVQQCLQKMKTFRFVACLNFLVDVLLPISKLSDLLQGESINLSLAQAAIQAAAYKIGSFDTGENVKNFELAASAAARDDAPGPLSFKGVCLTETECLLSADDRNNLLTKLSHELDVRFRDFDQNPVLSAIILLDVRLWPQVEEELRSFGIDELKLVVQHFHGVLHDRVTTDVILNEWLDIKFFVINSCKHLLTGKSSTDDLWKILNFAHKQAFGNVLLVLNILRIMPVSNAIVERCFSTMGIIKGDWRSCLAEHVLDHLIRIKREGPKASDPKAEELCRRAAVAFFEKKSRRPDTKPYGQRPSLSQMQNDSSLSCDCDDTITNMLDIE